MAGGMQEGAPLGVPWGLGLGWAQGKLYRADQWCFKISLGTLRAVALSGGGLERVSDLMASPKEACSEATLGVQWLTEMTMAGKHTEVNTRLTCGQRCQTLC